ncbi:MAG: hypothetical protein MZU91_01115 [Desulfosudis oleivorans]|nr:hypothetical protein [Desulfosudis oleivorans]
MWFVLATETPERIDAVIAAHRGARPAAACYNMPKEHEYFVGLRLEA